MDPEQDKTTENLYNFLVIDTHNLQHDHLGKA